MAKTGPLPLGTLESPPVPDSRSNPIYGSLAVLHVLAPAPAGGLERVVRALSRGQAARGHAVTIAAVVGADPGAPSGDGRETGSPVLQSLQGPGVTVVPVRVGGRAYLDERRQVVAVARRCEAQVAHTHGYRPDVVDAGALRGYGVPTVTTVHGFTGGGWKNRLYEHLQRRAFRRFDAVVAVSEPMRRGLVASGVSASHIRLIPNAYDATTEPLSRSAARTRLGLPDDAYVIGWVGRLSREKGLDVLIDALALLRDRPVVIAVVGDGRERARLQAQADSLQLMQSIKWLGLVSEAASLYRAFDAFVLSSRTEGTPIALFEAMDALVPVIATAVGGVPAVVSPSEAILVPSEQPAALAAALRAVRQEAAGARERAAAARERLKRTYAVDPWLDQYDSVYREILESASGRGRLSAQATGEGRARTADQEPVAP
jgi:glycosyltransferase involved in cell wall biosynthesis